jgi:hypothetical protein
VSTHKESVAFLTLRDVLRWGVNKVGPMEKGELSADEEFDRLESMTIEERILKIQELGKSLNEHFYHRFVDALVATLSSGTLDVSGWTRLAIKAAIVVCSERDLPVAFKNKNRTVSPVSYPKEGPLLDMFVESIFSGKWK